VLFGDVGVGKLLWDAEKAIEHHGEEAMKVLGHLLLFLEQNQVENVQPFLQKQQLFVLQNSQHEGKY
jgi:hypothetical protein